MTEPATQEEIYTQMQTWFEKELSAFRKAKQERRRYTESSAKKKKPDKASAPAKPPAQSGHFSFHSQQKRKER